MTTSNHEKRDPIKQDPLPLPGESLQEEIASIVDDRIMTDVLALFILWLFVGLEWVRMFWNWQPHPVEFTIALILLSIPVIRKIRRERKQVQQLRLGLRGERAVGQLLQDALLPKGYRVFHDISVDDFNIDHALIGPGGVFAIETKTNRKPDGDAHVSYDGLQVKVAGFIPDRDPVAQAKANADQLQEILFDRTGKKVTARGVVLYPGWWIDKQPRGVETWVLNENAFIGFLQREPVRLNQQEIDVLANGLARYVRDRIAKDA